MIKIKNGLILSLLFFSGLSSAQSNEELAKSYFLQAQEAYGNGKTQSAISSLDYCVKMLGETNGKIEALYIKIKRDDEHNLTFYYSMEIKQHLDNYLSLASADRPEYEEVIKLAASIKNRAESYTRKITEALQDNLKRNWQESGPILVHGLGYFNSNGKLAFAIDSDLKFNGEQFRDGYALIKEYASDGFEYKMTLIDTNGEKFSKTMYDKIYRVDKNVYKTVLTANDGNSYIGLINTSLNKELKIPNFISNYFRQFQNNGLAVFYVEKKDSNDEKGLISKNGEIIVEAIYTEIKPFKNGLATASGEINLNGKEVHVERLIKANGSISYEDRSRYSLGSYNDDGIVSFYNNSKYGYLRNGQVVIPEQYNFAGEFSEGLAIVDKNKDYLIIDKQNKQVGYIEKEFQYEYGDSQLFKYGMAVLKKRGSDSYFIINKYGEAITEEIKCISLSIISKNTLLVRNGYNGPYYIIDIYSKNTTDLNNINNLKIETIYNFNEGLALFKTKNVKRYLPDLYGYIDVQGNIVVPPLYYEGESFKDGLAIVYDKYFNEIVINPSLK
jgi:hypothetical protein